MTNFDHKGLICGIDEAGRGPLAGPVVAAACVLSINNDNDLLDDSKLLTAQKREELFQYIVSNAIAFGIGYSSPFEIDRFNIRNASLTAMKRAWDNAGCPKCQTYIDGRDIVPGLPDIQEAVIGGDGKIKAIAAASIIAKVMRDWAMEFYDRLFPDFLFGKHKGYGTKQHLEILHKFGPTYIHRQSFLGNFYAEKEKRDAFIADLF